MAINDAYTTQSTEEYDIVPPSIPTPVNDSSHHAQESALGLAIDVSTPVDVMVVDRSGTKNTTTGAASVVEDDATETEKATETDKNVSRSIGAAVVVGLVALPLVGHVFALIASGAAAYVTIQKQENLAGDVCRGAGDIALAARDKAVEVDAERNIVGRVRAKTAEAAGYLREENDRHRFTERTRAAVVTAWEKTRDFEGRHRLVERGARGAARCCRVIADRFSDGSEKEPLLKEVV